MTPKEKAKELFHKYATYVVMWTGGIQVENQNCKQCALIAVDEIIKANPHLWIQKTVNYDGYAKTYDEEVMNKEWWQEVKQEIEKL